MTLLTAKFCAYDHSPLIVKALNFCASCASEECLIKWSTIAHKQKFPSSVSANSMLTVAEPCHSAQVHRTMTDQKIENIRMLE